MVIYFAISAGRFMKKMSRKEGAGVVLGFVEAREWLKTDDAEDPDQQCGKEGRGRIQVLIPPTSPQRRKTRGSSRARTEAR